MTTKGNLGKKRVHVHLMSPNEGWQLCAFNKCQFVASTSVVQNKRHLMTIRTIDKVIIQMIINVFGWERVFYSSSVDSSKCAALSSSVFRVSLITQSNMPSPPAAFESFTSSSS